MTLQLQKKKNLITHKPRKNSELSDPQSRDSVRLYNKTWYFEMSAKVRIVIITKKKHTHLILSFLHIKNSITTCMAS